VENTGPGFWYTGVQGPGVWKLQGVENAGLGGKHGIWWKTQGKHFFPKK